MRSKGSSVSAALSSSSLYSSSSHMRCRVLRGSLSSTGMDTLDRSLPMLFLKMFHRLMLLVSGHGAGRQVRRPLRKALPAKSPFATRQKVMPHQQSIHSTDLFVTMVRQRDGLLVLILHAWLPYLHHKINVKLNS